MEESSLPGMGGSDGMSVFDLLSSTNNVRGIELSELTFRGVAVPSSFCATVDSVPGRLPNSEPTMLSLMVSIYCFYCFCDLFRHRGQR